MEIMILEATRWFTQAVYVLVALTGVAAAISAARSNDEAFSFLDRQPKMVWVGLLAGSAFMVFLGFPFLSWIGMVIIGLWWFDLRPSIRELTQGY